jgi:hypothetical protein
LITLIVHARFSDGVLSIGQRLDARNHLALPHHENMLRLRQAW